MLQAKFNGAAINGGADVNCTFVDTKLRQRYLDEMGAVIAVIDDVPDNDGLVGKMVMVMTVAVVTVTNVEGVDGVLGRVFDVGGSNEEEW
ncbi:hypothetical protein NDU88_008255 [Pleurodeles waltl]|uniref:Uncharacterized protein n=1 Tax=Pleurodeles waltl TaxID=8319 RepID=A0AAV7N622_PLEWA|nr:hypothetical protein NDU88_008255 [Pleurodeles waltl]